MIAAVADGGDARRVALGLLVLHGVRERLLLRMDRPFSSRRGPRGSPSRSSGCGLPGGGWPGKRSSPDHRRCLAAAFAVSAAALYLAVNLYSVDHRVIESIAANGPTFESMTLPARRRLFRPTPLVHRDRAPAGRLPRMGNPRAKDSAPVDRTRRGGALGRHAALLRPRRAAVGDSVGVRRAPDRHGSRDPARAARAPDGEWRGLTGAPLYERERGISPLAAIAAHAAGGAHASTPARAGTSRDGRGRLRRRRGDGKVLGALYLRFLPSPERSERPL